MHNEDLSRPCDACGKPIGGGFARVLDRSRMVEVDFFRYDDATVNEAISQMI